MSDSSFSKETFHALCGRLARKDKDLAQIIRQYGYPPLWHRPEGFATLVHIILEQQVSLASARAAYDLLKIKIGTINPKKVLALTDEELKACYFSRQKTIYVRHLASALVNKELHLPDSHELSNEEIRTKLIAIKGIGHWTIEVYLMMVLHRCDLFPLGDIALINSMKKIKGLPKTTTREELEQIASRWKPYRTIAAFLLWHAYINDRNMVLKDYD
jgi:DNA-3-methyladenine glycosylase II